MTPALFLHHIYSQYALDLFRLFQGFEVRGTEIRGRQGALDNIKSVILNYSLPYDISLNYKNFNFNEQLFGKREPVYGIVYGTLSNNTEDSVTENRRRRRSISGRDMNWEDFLRIIRKRESSHGKPDNFWNNDKTQLENEKENMDYPQHIADVRQKRQTSEIDCISRWFGEIYLFENHVKIFGLFLKEPSMKRYTQYSIISLFLLVFFQKKMVTTIADTAS